MAIRTRKDERARILALLEADFPDGDKLADAILKEAYALLQQRDWYVFGAQLDTLTFPYGFFATSNEAVKAALVAGGPCAGVVRVLPAAKLAERMAELDKSTRPMCECRHPWDIHLDQAKTPGCPTRGCPCERRHP